MGADIHIFAERRNGDQWELVPPKQFIFPFDRNYIVFSIFAGVRRREKNPFEQVAPRRGLPEDLSQGGLEIIQDTMDRLDVETFEEFCSDDLLHHSHSWFTVKELMDYPWDSLRKYANRQNPASSFREIQSYVMETMIPPLIEDSRPEDVRLVFWFDA